MTLNDGVGTVFAALAFKAEVAEVKGIDPFHEGCEMFLFVGDESGFKISFERSLCSDACASEVGGTDEGFAAIDDDGFGVDAGA